MMDYNKSCKLWPYGKERYFADKKIKPQRQVGGTCVSTCLGMLTDVEVKEIVTLVGKGKLNTQDPRSWSRWLSHHGMRLAYLPTDCRKLRFYMDELMDTDDLFTLSIYTGGPDDILKDPDSEDWVSGSHIVLLDGKTIYDPMNGSASLARGHEYGESHTKRIFRVVPADLDCEGRLGGKVI